MSAETVAGRVSDVFALALTALAIYVAGFGVFDNAMVSGGTVLLAALVGFGTLASRARSPAGKWLALMAHGLVAVVFALITWRWLQVMLEQEEFFVEISVFDDLLGWVAFAILGYLTWRHFGWPMLFVYLAFAAYVVAPGPVGGAAEAWSRVAENLWYSTDGVFGRPVEVVSRIVLIFIVFGAVLQASGAGEVLLKIAFAATGRLVGGPAHAAIVGSAMFGTMSGAAVANVVSTGVFTIPIIKKAGFKPRFAGAVEAAASTGGQIMPPVMGAVAFLMADITGIPYLEIVVAAAIPAIMYYLSLFIVVLIESRRLGIGAVPVDQRERLTGRDWLRSIALWIPLGVIIAVLVTGRTPQNAGFAALIAASILSLLLFPEFRSLRRIVGALVAAGHTMAILMIIVAAIGLVVGIINMTGIGLQFAEAIVSVSGESLAISLLLVMLASLVMGMGVPPGAAYLIIALVMGPALQRLGLPMVAAHLFVFYFGVLSVITPPVALAAFAAAPIAGSKPMETGLEAVRLSIAGFMIPFIFVYHADILLIEGVEPLALLWTLVAYLIATWSLASGIAGFDAARLPFWERPLRIVAGLAALAVDLRIALPAGGIALGLLLLHYSPALLGRPRKAN
jgi:TRAP transporter 4TM/12TM fusion protein